MKRVLAGLLAMNDFSSTRSYHPTTPDKTGADGLTDFELNLNPQSPDPPQCIGRYRVERVLGMGGYGIVYLAHDDLLNRLVAIKVPHASLVEEQQNAEAYLAEARTVANLDHPNIIPVYDVGGAPGFPCYVVSKHIDGSDLSARLQSGRLPLNEAVTLVAVVAEAVHYAHLQGLVHRDIKPKNILLDRQGKPFVADFGLALREQDFGLGPPCAGTPPYMSPEQARAEGHRVDGRSDVFSLGVVLYELLTGRRPFRGQTLEEVLVQICTLEARPPRQIDDTIPIQLERICLKALAKRATDRYTTARDLAEELRHSLDETRPATLPNPDGPESDTRIVGVIPKGLRAFDTDDAYFFLDLLPDPRDRHGVPEAIRFWKVRIEQTDPDQTFPVGLLYGPSGCGKSSLVKAGLLPLLAPHVRTIYLETTADLETRLLSRLVRMCPEATGEPDLPRALAAVRRGPPGEKVLLVLDQFEQWLHARRDGAGDELVRALRQCDGGRLQCLILVRDDFWMMSAHFMQELEVLVIEGHNAAIVDLFDPAHARKVLAAFGHAYRTLPPRTRDLDPAQSAFLDRAITELAQNGRVAPVRLALFADMIKRRPWTGKLLNDLRGTVGIGVTFLDENFVAVNAPPEHRLHQSAVRAVLGALVPAVGTDIKGYTRSRRELLEASGYSERPAEFDGLLRILINETRLLTPVATDSPSDSTTPVPVSESHYQLTHDYLIPSIRNWLTRERMGTWRGRAELRLADRAALWQAKPEVRQLPSLTEWLSIHLLTRPRTWTEPQRRMMRAASRRHLRAVTRVAAVLVLVVAAILFFRHQSAEERAAERSDHLVRHLLDADLSEVPRIVNELHEYRRWTDPALERVLADPTSSRKRRLRAGLGLPVDRRHAAGMQDLLLGAPPNEFLVLRDALASYHVHLVVGLWEVLVSERADSEQRFRAAAALAAYEPADPRWERVSPWVAEQLVGQPAFGRTQWVEALRPVKHQLIPHLAALIRDRTRPVVAAAAAETLRDYAADRPNVLVDTLADAAPDSFGFLFPCLRALPEPVIPTLTAALDRSAPAGQDANITASRRANLLIALLRMGVGERLWPTLRASPDLRTRSFVVDRFATLGCDPTVLTARLEVEPDGIARAALWLGLGGFNDRTLLPDQRSALIEAAMRAHRTDNNAAVHAATRWLLNRWGERNLVTRDWSPPGDISDPRRGWYVNGAGQTMVKITGPVEFMLGSPPDEQGRKGIETHHKVQINYSFDISMTEVTAGQYRQFLKSQAGTGKWLVDRMIGFPTDVPVRVTWYDAAAYCNWLSAAEGIPRDQWCYAPNEDGKYAEGMKIMPGYRHLKGYRLPTEEEWEFACRGGSNAAYCYGDGAELLPRYAWYAVNSSEEPAPVASLLPNAYGLFDMHGNLPEWCQDAMNLYGAGGNSDSDSVADADYRVVRSGQASSHAKAVRSAKRFADRPSMVDGPGFRIVHSRD